MTHVNLRSCELGTGQLPDEVSVAVKAFFNMCRNKMIKQGMTPKSADFLLATSVGAQVVSIATKDTEVFDHPVTELIRARDQAPEPVQSVAALTSLMTKTQRALSRI